MARLRYIADNPRGPRGGNHDARTLFSSADSARRSVIKGGQVLLVDLDGLPRVPAAEETSAARMDEALSWHRARLQHHESEMARLLPVAEANHPDIVIAQDAEQVGRSDEAGVVRARSMLWEGRHADLGVRGESPAWLTPHDLDRLREVVSEWVLEEDRLRRGGGATPAARVAFFVMRDLYREGKLGGRR